MPPTQVRTHKTITTALVKGLSRKVTATPNATIFLSNRDGRELHGEQVLLLPATPVNSKQIKPLRKDTQGKTWFWMLRSETLIGKNW